MSRREIVLRTRQSNGVVDLGHAMRSEKARLLEKLEAASHAEAQAHALKMSAVSPVDIANAERSMSLALAAKKKADRLPRIVFYGPTGFGKSVCFAHMSQVAALAGKRVAILCDLRVLVGQVSKTLDYYGISHAVIMSKSGRFHQSEKIHVCSIKTLAARGVQAYDVIIIDECHVLQKWVIQMCESQPRALVVGFSATPTTKSCGEFFDDIICPATTNELVDEGLLIMPTIYRAHEIDIAGLKPEKNGELDTNEVGKRTTKVVGNIVGEYVAKSNEHFGRPAKAIAFVSSVQAGADLAQEFAAAGLNFIAISYKDEDDFKADVFNEFEKPDAECSIHGLIAVAILTKGFDNVAVSFLIMACPFMKGFEQVVQQFGRGMRISPGKTTCVVNDHVGNTMRFQERLLDQWQNGVTELRRGKPPKAPKEKTPAEKEAATCPKCRAIWLGASDICSCCGFKRARKSNVEVVPGTLTKFEIKVQEQQEKKAKQSFFSQLVSIEQDKGYNRGWAENKFREKHGVWPNRFSREAEAPGEVVLNWVLSRNIAYAKSAAKRKASA